MLTIPGIVGSLLAAGWVVVVFEVVVFEVVVVVVVVVFDVVDVVLVGSSVAVPIIQYDFVVSRPGQVMPGFNFFRSATESPQLLAKLAHVAPLSGAVEKSHSTARGFRTAAIAGAIPKARRTFKCILGRV